jgi:pyruvate-ferredoxin/flavodoxin oxidoreductase
LSALALDADACKGCNLCVAVCKPEALRPEPFGLMAVERARATAALWRALPDTPGQILAAAQKLPEPGLLGALELSRHCLHALAPSDGAEPGSGARIALRTVLAVAEAHLQPQLQQHLRELDQLAAEFGARIRDLLAAALPAADLDALHEGLALLGMGAVALSSLATRLDEVSGSGRVDTARLQRLVETARALADLRFRIAEGSTGRGRARAGLVLAGGTGRALAGSFPWNPFAGPAVLDDGPDAAHRALGLLRGEAGALAQDFALLRRAKALLQPGAPGPRTLAFAELTAAERALCPPLLFVTGADSIARGGDAPLAAILASELPIKVLLLAETVAAPTQPAMPQCNPALMALAHRQAYVLQTSIAQQDHFAAGVLAALRHPGPALLHVLAPSPRRAGAAADQALRLAAAAVQSRAFPLFCHDPGKPGAFGEKLSLHGNPAPETAGTDDPMHLATWQTLQELAGIRTPFTVDVEQRAAAAVAEAHAQQLAELQARRIDELQQARAAVEQELLQRLQRKLVALAGGRRP